MDASREFFGVAKEYQHLLREIGLTRSEQVFTDPRIVPWRTIPERENCTMDVIGRDGSARRLHVKRHHPVRARKTPGEEEADGIMALQLAGIPTTPLVAWGWMADGRSFLITEDLTGYEDAEKLLQAGLPFDKLLIPTADFVARLHAANLHHRDLYLCHLFARVDRDHVDLRLIDAARVRRVPAWPFRSRWITKDLAQFWYSLLKNHVSEPLRDQWLRRYADQRKIPSLDRLRRAVQRKADWIARHDEKLRQKQPARNISIPQPH